MEQLILTHIDNADYFVCWPCKGDEVSVDGKSLWSTNLIDRNSMALELILNAIWYWEILGAELDMIEVSISSELWSDFDVHKGAITV